MQRKQSNESDHGSDLSPREELAAVGAGAPGEALHVRSYDHQEAYDLDVDFVTKNGETVFEKHYYLLPGDIKTESSVPSGNYELRVRLDNSHTETLDCRIDSSPTHTAVVEIGNGAVALTEGIQN
jgi:hypothetical protein